MTNDVLVSKYDVIFDILENYLKSLPDSENPDILDLNAGTGDMWEHLVHGRRDLLENMKQVKEITLAEAFNKYHNMLNKRTELVENYVPCRMSRLEPLAITTARDITIGIGLLNLFPMLEASKLLSHLLKITHKFMILEFDFSCSVSNAPTGVYNPSIDFIYNMLYNETSKIEIIITGKCNSIWKIWLK
jgi:hypothetical protein